MEMFSSNQAGLLRVVILCLIVYCSYGKRCLKNDDIGWRPENIYECNDPSYPECCEEDREFTCCEYSVSKNVREQFQLWGTVLVFCLLLFVVYLYFTRDSVPSYTCIGGTSLCACFETVGDRLLFRKRKMKSSDAKYKEDDRMGISTT